MVPQGCRERLRVRPGIMWPACLIAASALRGRRSGRRSGRGRGGEGERENHLATAHYMERNRRDMNGDEHTTTGDGAVMRRAWHPLSEAPFRPPSQTALHLDNNIININNQDQLHQSTLNVDILPLLTLAAPWRIRRAASRHRCMRDADYMGTPRRGRTLTTKLMVSPATEAKIVRASFHLDPFFSCSMRACVSSATLAD